jgi:hypothetical protein
MRDFFRDVLALSHAMCCWRIVIVLYRMIAMYVLYPSMKRFKQGLHQYQLAGDKRGSRFITELHVHK